VASFEDLLDIALSLNCKENTTPQTSLSLLNYNPKSLERCHSQNYKLETWQKIQIQNNKISPNMGREN
jgi:hypothetical protein